MELCEALIDLFTVFSGSGEVVKPLLNQREEREKQRETDHMPCSGEKQRNRIKNQRKTYSFYLPCV